MKTIPCSRQKHRSIFRLCDVDGDILKHGPSFSPIFTRNFTIEIGVAVDWLVFFGVFPDDIVLM